MGVVALEENWSRTAEGIMAVEANAKLHLDSVKAQFTDDQLDECFKKVFMGENDRSRVDTCTPRCQQSR